MNIWAAGASNAAGTQDVSRRPKRLIRKERLMRRTTFALASIASLGLLFATPSPARAGDDFEKGFKRELGAISARAVVGIGVGALNGGYGYYDPYYAPPRYRSHRSYDPYYGPRHRPHHRSSYNHGYYRSSCGSSYYYDDHHRDDYSYRYRRHRYEY